MKYFTDKYAVFIFQTPDLGVWNLIDIKMAWNFVAVGKHMKLFFNVTVDHTKTTGKLRYFITLFEKHIQTQWIYRFFCMPLESLHGCKLS